jgi:hypothetical protein
MTRALIELQDVVLLSECKRWVAKHFGKDTLFLTKNIKEAINMMQFSPIDLFLIELSSTPTEAAGLESIAALSFYYPSLNIGLLIPAAFSNELNLKFKELTSFYFLNSPTNLKEFIHLTELLKVICSQARPIVDMLIADYFRLVEIREKTCLLAIETEDKAKKGVVYFNRGIVYDAAYAHLKAESALLEILHWKNVRITFKNLDVIDTSKFRKHIHKSLTQLIAEAAKSKMDIAADLVNLSTEDDQPIELLIETITQYSAKEEEKAKAESEARLKREAEIAAKLKAEAAAKAKAEQEARAKAAAEAKAKAEAETRAKAEFEARLKREAEIAAKLKVEAAAKAKAEQEARAKVAAEAKAESEAIAARFKKLALDEILEPLHTIDDYLASGIFDMSANIFAKHSISSYDIGAITKNTVAVIESSLNTMKTIGFESCNFIQMNCQDSLLEAFWILEDQFVVAVVLKPEAKSAGLAKMYLAKACDTIHEELS